MTQLTDDNKALRQAIMYMDVQLSELRIAAAVAGSRVPETGCAFHTLLGANTAFKDVAHTTPLSDPRLIVYRALGLMAAVDKKIMQEEALAAGLSQNSQAQVVQ